MRCKTAGTIMLIIQLHIIGSTVTTTLLAFKQLPTIYIALALHYPLPAAVAGLRQLKEIYTDLIRVKERQVVGPLMEGDISFHLSILQQVYNRKGHCQFRCQIKELLTYKIHLIVTP